MEQHLGKDYANLNTKPAMLDVLLGELIRTKRMLTFPHLEGVLVLAQQDGNFA